jgi:hypothetical protein
MSTRLKLLKLASGSGTTWQGASIKKLKIFEAEGNVGGGLHFEGEAKKSDAKFKTLDLPQDREQARRTVDRFENAARDVLERNYCISDNVGQHAMDAPGSLLDEKWFGTEEEEFNWYVHPSFRHLQTHPTEYQLRLGDVVHSLQTDDRR